MSTKSRKRLQASRSASDNDNPSVVKEAQQRHSEDGSAVAVVNGSRELHARTGRAGRPGDDGSDGSSEGGGKDGGGSGAASGDMHDRVLKVARSSGSAGKA